MCITFVYSNPDDKSIKYKFILISNRDEFYARKTLEAQLRTEGDREVIYGTDVSSPTPGTWLGISKNENIIRIGNLLNVTGETSRGVKSRGPLVLDFISSSDNIEEHNEKLARDFKKINNFTFLSIEIRSSEIKIFDACNVTENIRRIPNGIFGVSNSPFNAPYRKVTTGTQQFRRIVESHLACNKENLVNSLMNFLKSSTKHLPCAELTKRRPLDDEIFSSIHVDYSIANYGSRNRSVILVDHNDNVDYVEERMMCENSSSDKWERLWLKIGKNLKFGSKVKAML